MVFSCLSYLQNAIMLEFFSNTLFLTIIIGIFESCEREKHMAENYGQDAAH